LRLSHKVIVGDHSSEATCVLHAYDSSVFENAIRWDPTSRSLFTSRLTYK
jgi:hypothetical protein